MRIFIPTRGRPFRQPTADALYEAGIQFTFVFSASDLSLDSYDAAIKNLYPKAGHWTMTVSGIMEKRQSIFEHATDNKIIMLDDDLKFYKRRRDGGFNIATKAQIRQMIKSIEKALDKNAHVGLVDKFMSQTRPRGRVHSGRYNQVLGYNMRMIAERVRLLSSNGMMHHDSHPKFRLSLNQEHDMHLQLLELGFAPTILTEYSKNAAFYAAGGLSHMRTKTLERSVFKKLQALWPQYVKLRKSKHSIGGVAATFNWRAATANAVARNKEYRK